MTAPDNPETPRHIAVMASEVVRELITKPDGTYLDATIGFASHAERIMERLNDKGRLIGLDRDADAVAIAAVPSTTVVHCPYGERIALSRVLPTVSSSTIRIFIYPLLIFHLFVPTADRFGYLGKGITHFIQH